MRSRSTTPMTLPPRRVCSERRNSVPEAASTVRTTPLAGTPSTATEPITTSWGESANVAPHTAPTTRVSAMVAPRTARAHHARDDGSDADGVGGSRRRFHPAQPTATKPPATRAGSSSSPTSRAARRLATAPANAPMATRTVERGSPPRPAAIASPTPIPSRTTASQVTTVPQRVHGPARPHATPCRPSAAPLQAG